MVAGIALLDVEDVARVFEEASNGSARPVRRRLDSGWLRRWLGEHLNVATCLAVGSPMSRASRLVGQAALEQAGWRRIAARHALFGPGIRPAAAYVCATLECLRFEYSNGPGRPVFVIGHDNAYAESMRRFAQVGGRVYGIRFAGPSGDRRLELAWHVAGRTDRCSSAGSVSHPESPMSTNDAQKYGAW